MSISEYVKTRSRPVTDSATRDHVRYQGFGVLLSRWAAHSDPRSIRSAAYGWLRARADGSERPPGSPARTVDVYSVVIDAASGTMIGLLQGRDLVRWLRERMRARQVAKLVGLARAVMGSRPWMKPRSSRMSARRIRTPISSQPGAALSSRAIRRSIGRTSRRSSRETFDSVVKPLLEEAHERVARSRRKKKFAATTESR
jgi:hypothetical protein